MKNKAKQRNLEKSSLRKTESTNF